MDRAVVPRWFLVVVAVAIALAALSLALFAVSWRQHNPPCPDVDFVIPPAAELEGKAAPVSCLKNFPAG